MVFFVIVKANVVKSKGEEGLKATQWSSERTAYQIKINSKQIDNKWSQYQWTSQKS